MLPFDPRDSLNPYHPFFGMWMAISRKTVPGRVINPEQRITREEALRLWTINGAYKSFEENLKGSIEAGKLADMIVIQQDFFKCPEHEIKAIDVLMDGGWQDRLRQALTLARDLYVEPGPATTGSGRMRRTQPPRQAPAAPDSSTV